MGYYAKVSKKVLRKDYIDFAPVSVRESRHGNREICAPPRGDAFELKGKGDVPCFCAIPLTDPRPAATACRSRRGEAPEGSSLFRPGVEARSADDPG